MKTWLAKQSWSQRIGYGLGITYVLVGLVGFVVTSGVGFFATSGKDLVIFEINPLHNVIHLLVGAALLGAARASATSSRLMNSLVGGVYLGVAIAGTVIVQMDVFPGLVAGRSDLNILALNHPDNLLHYGSAFVLLGVALYERRRRQDGIVEAVAPAAPAVVEEPVSLTAALPADADDVPSLPSGALVAGQEAPRTGTYRCACGAFQVGIRAHRVFPECPEPNGSDDDHYFLFHRAATSPTARKNGTAKPRAARPKPGTAAKKTASSGRRSSAASRGSRR